MKRVSFLAALLLLISVLTARAEIIASGQLSGDQSWTLTDDGVLTITGSGEMYSNSYPLPWDDQLSYIETVIISDGVTSIGNYAFSGCTSLTEVTIPGSVTRIGAWAFEGCTSLAEVTIPESVTEIGAFAFSGCTSLTEVIIPEGVTVIDGGTFSKCTSLAEVTIPGSVTEIESFAFEGCTSLAEVTIPENLTNIGLDAFRGCTSLVEVTIPESVTKMDVGAFYGCSNLKTLNYNAADCNDFSEVSWTAIETLNIGGTVKTIPESAFSDCTGLRKVIIPEGVTEIGGYAFEGCTSLAEVTIPESVTEIGVRAFDDCTSLTEVIIPEGVTVIDNGTFSKCTSLAEVTIHGSVTEIGDYAFYDCTGLTEVPIQEGLTYIGGSAFENCTSLHSITVPESVTSIGSKAFAGCSSIVSILIPEGVRIEDSPMGGQYPLLKSLIIRSDIDFDGQILDFAASPLLRSIEVPANVLNDGRDDVGFTRLPIDSTIVSLGTIDYNGFEFLTQCRNTLRHIDLSAAENTELPAEALSNCFMVETILLPSDLKLVGYSAFLGCISLKSIDIPASVTDIDDSAFEDCRSITAINFGSHRGALHRIGNWAFYNCHQLRHLIIPEGVTEIGEEAFYGCTYLEDLELPSTVTRIGDNCFALCSKLKQIRVRAAVPPEIEAKTFYDVNREIPVYVPEDYLDDYREDPYWREFNLIGEGHGGTVGTDHTAISGLYRMEDGRIVLIEEMPVSVYTVTGALIYSGTATEVALSAPGVYLLRIGGETVKVARP